MPASSLPSSLPRDAVVEPSRIDRLVELLRGRRVAALTGAGISTESGIPDYRGEGTRARARNPIQHREFVRDASVRRRYWARAFVGWERFSSSRPNAGHRALAALEHAGVVTSVITQNVDRLHHAAGSRRVIELHGALADVRCLGCGVLERREDVQHRLLLLNPTYGDDAEVAPDGDAEVRREAVEGFRVADCLACGGPLKPDVVFFGGSVPQPIVDAAFACVAEADALLVLGTSLTVYSGFRFVRRARELGAAIAVVNLGQTRGDALADVLVSAPLGRVLAGLERALASAA